MNDLGTIGEILGKTLSQQRAVNINVPEVVVSVDAAPLADAVRAGHDMNAKALEGVGGLFADAICKALGEAVHDLAPSDLAGMEAKVAALSVATVDGSAAVVASIDALRKEIAANTAASERVAAMVRELVAATLRPKRVSYDEMGRITMVGTA